MGKADPGIKSSDSNEVTAIGNLFIESDPDGSEVFLDDQSIGFTPLALYGVGAGLYDLRVASEYYVPASQVLRLEPNIDNNLNFDLGIDIENPDIKKQLGNPGKLSLISGAISFGQISWFLIQTSFLPKYDPGTWWYLDYLIMSPRYGLLLAGDELMGSILSTVSLVGYMGWRNLFDGILGTEIGSSNWIDGVYTSLLIGPMVYELFFTSSTVTRNNKKIIDKFNLTGVEFEQEDIDDFRIVAQTGGGSLLSGGVTWAPFWNWLWFEQLAGISLTQYMDILKPALSLTSKVYAYPFGNAFKLFRPYMGGLLNLSSNFNSVTTAGGLTSGFDISLKWFDIFLEADLYFANSRATVPDVLALGVRL